MFITSFPYSGDTGKGLLELFALGAMFWFRGVVTPHFDTPKSKATFHVCLTWSVELLEGHAVGHGGHEVLPVIFLPSPFRVGEITEREKLPSPGPGTCGVVLQRIAG